MNIHPTHLEILKSRSVKLNKEHKKQAEALEYGMHCWLTLSSWVSFVPFQPDVPMKHLQHRKPNPNSVKMS